jgi:glycosyltransferase involved in cell wall biosynthesis
MWNRKRHELAAEIESICLVFAMHLGDEALRRFKEVRGFMPKAFLANGDPTLPGGHRYLEQSEVNKFYNASKVGLCLSEWEGASLAAVEYMLAGLPVVSTPSLGGRDLFFQASWCEICDANPASVKRSVTSMIDRRLDAETIPNGTLARVYDMREQWVRLVDTITRKMTPTANANFSDVFPAIRENWCGLPYKSVNHLLLGIAELAKVAE